MNHGSNKSFRDELAMSLLTSLLFTPLLTGKDPIPMEETVDSAYRAADMALDRLHWSKAREAELYLLIARKQRE
jgi:hypothetical protein